MFLVDVLVGQFVYWWLRMVLCFLFVVLIKVVDKVISSGFLECFYGISYSQFGGIKFNYVCYKEVVLVEKYVVVLVDVLLVVYGRKYLVLYGIVDGILVQFGCYVCVGFSEFVELFEVGFVIVLFFGYFFLNCS